jgi:hypothetical protein
MRLIAHAAIDGDLRQSSSSTQYEHLASSDTLPCDIGQGSLAEAPAEGSEEVSGTQLYGPGKIGGSDLRAQVGLDVGRHALFAP